VVVDGFEGGGLSVPSSLLRFYPARCLAFPPAAAAVFAPPVEEVALDVRVLPKAPPMKGGVFNVSTLSTREGIDGSSNAQEEMVFRQV